MQEFKHSVKVPRHYKLAANILKKAVTEGASVKSLVFEDKLKHFRTNVLYALITEAIKHNSEIDKLFESTEILKNESRLDPWLAKILTVELLFGKKCLPGQSKPELTVASYKEQFEKYSTENPDQIKKKGVRKPRYVRINTNLLTTSDAIRAFQDEGYRFVRCTSAGYEEYLQQLERLEQYDFMQDYHVKTVFAFAPGTQLHEHELYLESKIILQDKATAMAVHLLAPPAGAVVLDMCAAPGMKTTQLAAYIKNQGTVYAVERNAERYKTLCDFVEKTGSTCVKTINKDVLEIKRGEYPDVEYILLDPSCSGSGMDLCAHKYVEEARLARLTSLQEKFLKHALNAFPKAKRIVYSTCSMLPQENERVVTNVISACRAKWNVISVKELLKEQWKNFGSGMYGSIGTRCMYARPESDLSTGFFLAVIDRDLKQRDSEKPKIGDENQTLEKNSADVLDENKSVCAENGGEEQGDATKRKKKKLKKEKDVLLENDDTIASGETGAEHTGESEQHVSSGDNTTIKKRKQETGDQPEEADQTVTKNKKKKKKNKGPEQQIDQDLNDHDETYSNKKINVNAEPLRDEEILVDLNVSKEKKKKRKVPSC